MGAVNIIFSTTRQWNPGDEFILFGVRQIFEALGLDVNPLIYNRNPAVCPEGQASRWFTPGAEPAPEFARFDNSLKPGADYGFVDWVVFAGTPEWAAPRLVHLYDVIRDFHLPVMLLGVGGGFHIHLPRFRAVLEQAKAFSVRDRNTLEGAEKQGFAPTLLPCPALLAAPFGVERNLSAVRRVGLIYQARADRVAKWQGLAPSDYENLLALFRRLRDRRADLQFEIVCHYIDEIAEAIRDFPDLEIRYSYDARDYLEIYQRFDFVVGPRVHGVGLAASLAIPGLALAHDIRGEACEGFLADIAPLAKPVDQIAQDFERALGAALERSAELKRHKLDTIERYAALVRAALPAGRVDYGGSRVGDEKSGARKMHDDLAGDVVAPPDRDALGG